MGFETKLTAMTNLQRKHKSKSLKSKASGRNPCAASETEQYVVVEQLTVKLGFSCSVLLLESLRRAHSCHLCHLIQSTEHQAVKIDGLT